MLFYASAGHVNNVGVFHMLFSPPGSGGVKNAHMSFIENTAKSVEPTVPQDVGRKDGGGEGDDRTEVGGGQAAGREAQGVTFLYRLVVGQAHRSYGLNVARAAGMDEEMIALAATKSAEMRDRQIERLRV